MGRFGAAVGKTENFATKAIIAGRIKKLNFFVITPFTFEKIFSKLIGVEGALADSPPETLLLSERVAATCRPRQNETETKTERKLKMKTEKKEINGPFRIMKLLEGWRWEDHSQKRFDTIAEAKKELKRLVAIAREYGEDLDVRFSKLCIAYDVGFRVKTMNTIELFPERCR